MQFDEVRKSPPRTLQSGKSGQEIADNDSDELFDGCLGVHNNLALEILKW